MVRPVTWGAAPLSAGLSSEDFMPSLNPRTAPPNHSNRVTFDEAAMTAGIGLYAAVALRHLAG